MTQTSRGKTAIADQHDLALRKPASHKPDQDLGSLYRRPMPFAEFGTGRRKEAWERLRLVRMQMTRPAKDDEREERIHMEIIVDAYGPEEQALGWYYYLEGTLYFPFTARCIVRRATSPLEVGDEVEVVGMPPEEECEHDMLVLIRWKPHEFAVPLRQLEGSHVDDETQQAIEDWHYWVNQGYAL